MAALLLPRLYVIVDCDELRRRAIGLREFAESMRSAGAGLVQLRDKSGSPQAILEQAATLTSVFQGNDCRLILNDRADLAALAGFDGVHVGQDDLGVSDARLVLNSLANGAEKIVGVSTHNDEQVRLADLTSADYLAVGPVFATGTKLDASPVVGLDGVRRARGLTAKPLVAIGGITRRNAASVFDAGANAVAVISGIFADGETVEEVARDFLVNFG